MSNFAILNYNVAPSCCDADLSAKVFLVPWVRLTDLESIFRKKVQKVFTGRNDRYFVSKKLKTF